MTAWIMVAVAGGSLFLSGMVLVALRYRRGDFNRFEFLVLMISGLAVVPIAVFGGLYGEPVVDWAGFLYCVWLGLMTVMSCRRRKRIHHHSNECPGRENLSPENRSPEGAGM
ncbi:MAG: hypothetical protein JSV84_13505 [Gemmatimonadota bacterium]|nr:MAG: hypothetical protein JSV84_13505 [Gemmatimonadota bacterium]